MSTPQPNVADDVSLQVAHDAYAIYESHNREVGLARLLVGDVATAEDIVHDATSRLHASLSRIQDHEPVVAYYRSIVLNLARNQVRRRVRKRAAEQRLRTDAGNDPLNHDVRQPDRDSALGAVMLLRRHQEYVLLRHYSDLDERSIAATLGISIGSVKKHLHRASERLATTLKVFS